MWHWNSLWAHAPGDPPAVDDPKLWATPWTSEQAYVVQARTWDTFVSASRAWWSFWMAAMPMPGALPVGEVPPPAEAASPPRSKRVSAKRVRSTTASKGRSSRSPVRSGVRSHGA